MKTRLVYAEDHQVVRQGILQLLSKAEDIEVVGTANDGPETIKLCQNLRPDLLLLDLILPTLNGLELIRQVRAFDANIKAVVLSMHAEEAYVVEALKVGAQGYVLKDADEEELLDGIRTVAKGRRYLCKSLSERAIDAFLEHPSKPGENILDGLTLRERLVLDLAANGTTTAEIAKHLGISPRTAETHRGNLMKKLGLHSQTDLVRFAIRHEIIPL